MQPLGLRQDITSCRKWSMNKAALSNGRCEHATTTRQPARKLIAVLYAQWPFIGLLLCGKWKSPCICCSGLLDEGSGSFCGDTYYLRYWDNSLYLLYLTGYLRNGNSRPSLCSIDIQAPTVGPCDDVFDSRTWMSVSQRHSLENTISTTRAACHPLTVKEPSA